MPAASTGGAATRRRGGGAAGLEPAEVSARLSRGEIMLIDVREADEAASERIEGAVAMPLSTFDPAALPVADARRVVFLCGGGKRSGLAAARCRAAGVPAAAHVRGGLAAWKAAGLPTERRGAAAGVRRRTIAFVGGCQALMLAGQYRRRVALFLDEDVVHINIPFQKPEADLRDALKQLERVDLVVDQKFDFPDAIPAEFFQGRKLRRVRFPYVGGRLYWPHTGAAHPRFAESDGRGSFPYVAEFGDTLLNRMIEESIPPDEALARYDAAIAAGAGRIPRLAEFHLERQRDRDAACDMRFADFIAENYRREALFSTQGHPNLAVSRLMIEQVLTSMAVPYSLIDAALRLLWAPPFPRGELPIHPRVAEILGLSFVAPGQRYVFMHEGAYTFEDYARRYMACEWDADLERGLATLHSDAAEAAVALVQASLSRCEGSGQAWRQLAVALAHLGRDQEADEAMATALRRDPKNHETHAAWAGILGRRRDYAAAEDAARIAITLCPVATVGHRMLADLLGRQSRYPEAIAVARIALAIDPADGRSTTLLAHLLRLARRSREAADVLRRACELEPDNASFRRQLAEAEARLDPGAAKAA